MADLPKSVKMRARALGSLALVGIIASFVWIQSRDAIDVSNSSGYSSVRSEVRSHNEDGSRPSVLPPRPVSARPSVGVAAPQAKPELDEVRSPAGTLLKNGTRDTPWDLIAPGDKVDNMGLEAAREFVEASTPIIRPRFISCSSNYKPPPALEAIGFIDGEMILDVETTPGRINIVNASLGDANFVDAALETCLKGAYSGVSFEAATTEPNRRYRLRHQLRFGFVKSVE